MNIHEAAGTQLVPAKRKNLPNRTLRAFDNAKHIEGLSRSAKDVLAEIARFVAQDRPLETVFAHNATIAIRIGMSERTLYRQLHTLRDRGLIEIEKQERKSRNGRFSVARIRLTMEAAILLGLIEAPAAVDMITSEEAASPALPSQDETAPPETPQAHATKDTAPAVAPAALIMMIPEAIVCPAVPNKNDRTLLKTPPVDLTKTTAPTDVPAAVVMITPEEATCPALANQDDTTTPETPLASTDKNTPATPVIHSPPSAKMAHGHTLTEPTISKSHPLPRAENGLPADLTWLTGNGLSRAGIFKLMGQARAKAKRLSDIVTVIRDYLQDVKGGRLYAYLAKLIDGPTDFAVAAATERRRLADAHTAKALANKVAVFKIRFRNVALTNPQQSRLYLIDERAAFVQVFGGAYPTTAPLNDPREWIERIESGRLVMATLETEQRLQGLA